jgi:hypothetical protein
MGAEPVLQVDLDVVVDLHDYRHILLTIELAGSFRSTARSRSTCSSETAPDSGPRYGKPRSTRVPR